MICYEIELVDVLRDLFVSRGHEVYLEAPNMGQSVDIVTINRDKLTFVEAKINKWRTALEQCVAHELVADYIYIALAQKQVSAELEKTAKEKGYGVILCDKYSMETRVVIDPIQNKHYWPPQRDMFVNTLRSYNNGN